MEFFTENIESIGVIVLLIAGVAQRIAQLTPGKRDDEITGKIEAFLRKGLDFMAGNHGTPGDPGAIKPDKD